MTDWGRDEAHERLLAARALLALLDRCDCPLNVMAVAQMFGDDPPIVGDVGEMSAIGIAAEWFVNWLKEHNRDLTRLHRVGASAMAQWNEDVDYGAGPHC